MAPPLPDLSRFELQCLRRLWARREASVRHIHGDLEEAPSYSTVRKIFERLESKGAVRRTRRDGKAWLYRPVVHPPSMIRKEIRRFLDSLFDGAAAPLVAHLAEMDALSLEDLREIEKRLGNEGGSTRDRPGARAGEKPESREGRRQQTRRQRKGERQ